MDSRTRRLRDQEKPAPGRHQADEDSGWQRESRQGADHGTEQADGDKDERCG